MSSLMKTLFEQYNEEVEGVEEYSKCAMEYKDNPELHKMYLEMAGAELGHAMKLKEQILKQTATEVEPAEAVIILHQIWKDQETDMAEKLAVAKGYLDQVR